jgi:hypothetical protein
MGRCAIGMLLLVRMAAAQPDARALLKQVAAAYAKVPGYRLEAAITRPANFPASTLIAIWYFAPDWLMLEDKTNHKVTSVLRPTIRLMPRARAPQVSPAQLRNEALAGVGFPAYDAIAERLRSARVLREETLTVDGAATRCLVVEASYLDDQESRYWIDPARNVVLREDDFNQGEPYHTIEIVKLSWNLAVPEAVFDRR